MKKQKLKEYYMEYVHLVPRKQLKGIYFQSCKNYPSLALSDVSSAQKQIYCTKNISSECTDVIEWLYMGSHLTCSLCLVITLVNYDLQRVVVHFDLITN